MGVRLLTQEKSSEPWQTTLIHTRVSCLLPLLVHLSQDLDAPSLTSSENPVLFILLGASVP